MCVCVYVWFVVLHVSVYTYTQDCPRCNFTLTKNNPNNHEKLFYSNQFFNKTDNDFSSMCEISSWNRGSRFTCTLRSFAYLPDNSSKDSNKLFAEIVKTYLLDPWAFPSNWSPLHECFICSIWTCYYWCKPFVLLSFFNYYFHQA